MNHPTRVDLNDDRHWRPEWAGVVAIRQDTGEVIPKCFMADEAKGEWAAYETKPDGSLALSMKDGKPAALVARGRGPVKLLFPWEQDVQAQLKEPTQFDLLKDE